MIHRAIIRALVLVLILVVGTGVQWAGAQSIVRAQTNYFTVYRPAGVEYSVYPTEHFDIIFQKGYERSAWLALQVLEDSFPVTDSLVGLDRPDFRMPVVLNGYNDRSNGFVRVLPFKQEIEIPSIIDDVIPTRYSSWMAGVAPHELTHALHAEVNDGLGVGRFIRFFAPDAARSINLFVPSGMTEGIAVYRESQYETGAGRLNAPLFTMKYRAAMLSDDPWSLGQMLYAPSFTYPFDRHYIAGGHMVEYLASRLPEQGTGFFRRTTRFNYRFPFLGYGVALWRGTGQTPGELEATIRQGIRQQEERRLDALGPLTTPHVVTSAPGLLHRRPYWLDDRTVLVHASGYNLSGGFYRIDTQTGTRTRVGTQSITEDFTYSLGADSTFIVFARYRPDLFVENKSIAEVYRLRLRDGHAERLTTGGRVYAPVRAPEGGLWAVQTDGPFNQWAHIGAGGAVTPLTRMPAVRFQQIAPSPNGQTVAVLLNIEGDQSVYRATQTSGEAWQFEPWIALDAAVIYDLSWSPDGRYVLFTADATGIANIYAYDTQTERAVQLTNVPFGAQEPALAPDGTTLAFVNYQHERFDLVTMPFEPDDAYRPVALASASSPAVERSSGAAASRPPVSASRGVLQAARDTSAGMPPEALRDVRPYRAWRHLAPRMVYPTLRYDADERDATGGPFATELGVGVGLAVEGGDPLQRWAYSGETFWQDGRLWGEMRVENGHYLLRPSLSVYDRPFLTTVRLEAEDGATLTDRAGVEERGVALGLRLPMTLRSNVSASVLHLGLETEWRQTRLFDDGGATLRGFRDRLTLNPTLVYAYRLLANPRDIAPSSGLVFTAFSELDAHAEGVTPSRALNVGLRAYVPVLARTNTSVRLGGSFLTQNRGSIFNLDAFLPRGYSDTFLGSGNFVRFDAEIVQPITFVDDGWVWLPVYLGALYGYGFAQTLSPATSVLDGPHLSSVGVGIGARLRVLYQLAFDLRIGAAYQIQERRFEVVYR